MRAAIFANGPLDFPGFVYADLLKDDWIIAADGGALHCLALGLSPDVLIGDFDSLDLEHRRVFEQAGTLIMPHPAQKDETDLELALRYAIEAGMSEIVIFGGMGARWDQSLANLLLPALPEMSAVRIWMTDGPQAATLLRGGASLEIQGRAGDVVSLLPLAGDACGVTTQGLAYALHDEDLLFGATRGVSNVLIGEAATITLREGLLTCIVIHAVDEE